jgi:hypothetical protein
MTNDSNQTTARAAERQVKWLSWVTLFAGAVMCAIAVLLS